MEAAYNLTPVARTVMVGARHLSELAYLCCYPLVPAAFITLYVNASIDDVSRYWTAVFLAGFVCYVSLPWLVSRPPRVIDNDHGGDVTAVSPVRGINLQVLGRLSHGWNTFPSGHVAVASAAALSTITVMPRGGVAFAIVAAGISIGSVVGRYHYLIDAVIGLIVGVAAWAISWCVRPLV